MIIVGVIACVLSVIYAIYGCPIKYVTGISCMGCGMTRAFWAAGRMQFVDAFHYHPLWPLVIVWIPIYFFRKKINKNVFNVLLGLTVIAFVVVFFMRMADPHDHVVVFEPAKSIFARFIHH